MIDLHAHILPCADHGSPSVDVSLKQLELAENAGITGIVATPHFYPARENVERFISRRDAAYSALAAKLSGISIELRLGAEVLICDNLEEIPGLERLCFYGSKIILLELPFTDFDKSFRDTVIALRERGMTVVIAHADRYDRHNIDTLIACGARVQLNADSLTGLIRPRHLYDWIEKGHVVALGSDIHLDDKRAYRDYLRAVKRLGPDRFGKINTAARALFETTKPK